MNNKFLLNEIKITGKLIIALNEIIIEQENQIEHYRSIITQLEDMMNEAHNIINLLT